MISERNSANCCVASKGLGLHQMTPPRLLKTKNCQAKLMFKAMFDVSVYLPKYQSPKIKIIVDLQRKTFMPK